LERLGLREEPLSSPELTSVLLPPTIVLESRYIWSTLASGRRPWFPKFRTALAAADSLEALERLLRFRVERWRGRTMDSMEDNDEETSLERGG